RSPDVAESRLHPCKSPPETSHKDPRAASSPPTCKTADSADLFHPSKESSWPAENPQTFSTAYTPPRGDRRSTSARTAATIRHRAAPGNNSNKNPPTADRSPPAAHRCDR